MRVIYIWPCNLCSTESQHVLVEGKHVNKALNVEHSQATVDVDIVNFTKVKLSDMEDFHHWNDRFHVIFFFLITGINTF